MKGWSAVKDFFAVSKKDRAGLLIMSGLVIVLFILPDLPRTEKWQEDKDTDTTWIAEWQLFLDTMAQSSGEPKNVQALISFPDTHSPSPVSLFVFDPNTLPEEGWKRLGLRPKTIQTILNYRNKGGVFRKPEDMSRVYGLFPDEYERLKPFILINKPSSRDTLFKSPREPFPSRRQVFAVDINTADSAGWEALPGIGPRLAQRIVRFREALGGFYSIEQVSETFGLPDSTFQKIEPYLQFETTLFRKIDINNISAAELARHPYFSRSIATRIVAYREQHGSFENAGQLLKITGINDSLLHKWTSYLEYGTAK